MHRRDLWLYRILLVTMSTIQFMNVTDHTDPGKILEEILTARSQGFDNGRQLSEFVLVRDVSCI